MLPISIKLRHLPTKLGITYSLTPGTLVLKNLLRSWIINGLALSQFKSLQTSMLAGLSFQQSFGYIQFFMCIYFTLLLKTWSQVKSISDQVKQWAQMLMIQRFMKWRASLTFMLYKINKSLNIQLNKKAGLMNSILKSWLST